MNYTTNRIFLDDMGTVDAINVQDNLHESKEEQWLWQVNRMRDHDGLRLLTRVPSKVKFTALN
jgi:hypothetical protein